ncbi:MAG: DUF2868 domain-containing protein [Rubrivivax sp.]
MRLPEAAMRRLLLLRAHETATPEPPAWTAADRDWATRVARAGVGDDAAPARFIDERTTHAMQRLAARDSAVRRALEARLPLPALLAAAALLGLLAGALADHVGAARRIDLLAPPMLVLLLWNTLVYLWMAGAALWPRQRRPGLRRVLARLLQPALARSGPLARFGADWAAVSAPLQGARVAALLHVAAAALALGLIGGLYLRGLVLDYRAGWESTLLDATQVHALLQRLLAPASAFTGIVLPDLAQVQALRVQQGQVAQGEAAPWLHLDAATLLLAVVLPRLALALAALLRSAWLARRLPLDLGDPWLQRLLAQAPRGRQQLWLLPHAQALSAQAALGLRERLARLLGDPVQLNVADALPYGDEDDAARCTPPPGSTQLLLAVDLASTPEAEVHGRWLATVAAAAPTLPRALLADATALTARSAHAPERLVARREAWAQLAASHGCAFAVLDDDDALARALRG